MDFFLNFVKNFGQTILGFLPKSPFVGVIDTIHNLPWLSYVNWFIPIGQIITVLEIWISAVAVFYVYKAISKWVGLL